MDGNFAMEVSRLVTENVVRENFLVELFNVEICEVVTQHSSQSFLSF